MNNEQLFSVVLEDYSAPRYQYGGRNYVGTKAEIDAFVDRLEKNTKTAKRYGGFIDGVKQYDEKPNAVHQVGGGLYPVLYPVEEVCRSEFVLSDHKWLYEDRNENVHRLRADLVRITQMVVKTENKLLRCSMAFFEGLSIFCNLYGWIFFGSMEWGFPEMVFRENQEDYNYRMSLYIGQKVYELEDKEQAFRDMKGMIDYDMTDVTRDIIGLH